MNQEPTLPDIDSSACIQYVVEAFDTSERKRLLAAWLERQHHSGATTHFVSCDSQRAGLWAGLSDLLRGIVPEVEGEAPDLIRRHSHELTLVLPSLLRTLEVPNQNLADLAIPEEKVRNYPVDRAFRIIHGLIDLLSDWNSRRHSAPWVIVCDRFDEAGALVKMFFRELMRRRGRTLRLTLVLAVRPGKAGMLADSVEATYLQWHLQEEQERRPDPRQMEERARDIEAQGKDDYLILREHLSELIYYWRNSNHPEKSLVWVGFAFSEYNHFGFYEDALPYGMDVLRNLDVILASETTPFTRWNLVGALTNCQLALGQPEKALEIAEHEGLAKVDDLADRSRIFYVLALIHSRFLPKPDFAKAEDYISRGLEVLEKADVPEHERLFMEVFLYNGLAYIRHRQGRPQEALAFCRSGFELLETKLRPDQHLLHRSVLLYNTAQVYAALREWNKALEYYTATMKFDPNYSEYYNERGNTYLNLGRLDEAIVDYHCAIELSAPYQEVWTNLGQAYKLAGRLPEAVEAYSHALDLDPHQVLPRLGRAQSYDALGRTQEALKDYSAALQQDPTQALALINRASLWYDAGELQKSLEDLDRAVALEPANADFRYNRSVALADLGRCAEAIRDLQFFLELRPDTAERDEIEVKIACLSASPEPQPSQVREIRPGT